jgi:thiamine biosynthesis lipoprotein
VNSNANKIVLARNAMATRFELVLAGKDPSALRGAGEEALDEIERIEGQLSLFRNSSEISLINAEAGERPVRVSPEVFSLLKAARKLWQKTNGAFDITVAPLARCWGFMKGSGARPPDEEIARARELVGMQMVELDEESSSVRFQKPGMMLDLGSIGKGYALDLAAEILRDSGVENALLHGGTSTIFALGVDPEVGPWKIVIERPSENPVQPNEENVVAVVTLQNEAISVSAVWGKFFMIDGKSYGHVIDPRTGWPCRGAILGAVKLPNAAETDALSTAVLLAGATEIEALVAGCPGLSFLQLGSEGSVRARGIEMTQAKEN